ncbi:hypothetical protein H0H93_001115, partial [Arthromyces matolae]
SNWKQKKFSVDDLGIFMARVKECHTSDQIFTLSKNTLENLPVRAKQLGLHTDEVFLLAMKTRRLAILKKEEENLNKADPPRWVATLKGHFNTMQKLAAKYDPDVQKWTKEIVDNLREHFSDILEEI